MYFRKEYFKLNIRFLYLHNYLGKSEFHVLSLYRTEIILVTMLGLIISRCLGKEARAPPLSSPLLGEERIDRTREIGGNRAYYTVSYVGGAVA